MSQQGRWGTVPDSGTDNDRDRVGVNVPKAALTNNIDNRLLGKLSWRPPGAARSIPQIEVTFDIDANGGVNVSAQDKATNKTTTSPITASCGSVRGGDPEDLVKDEAADARGRGQEEARGGHRGPQQLESLTFSVQKHLDDNSDKIPEAERTELDAALKDAKDTVENNRTPRTRRSSRLVRTAAEGLAQDGRGPLQAAGGTEGAAPAAHRLRRRGRARPRRQGRRHRRRIHRTPKA